MNGKSGYGSNHGRPDGLSTTGVPAMHIDRDLQPSGNGERLLFPRPIAFNGLLTNKILTALPGADFAHLLPYFEPVSLVADEPIYDLGQTIDHVYFPETTVISHLHVLDDGSTVGGALVGKEGVVGISAVLDSRPAMYLTLPTLGGSAIRVNAAIIRKEFFRGGVMQRVLLGYIRARLAQLSQQAVCNGRHTLHERLCSWLLMLHGRTTDGPLLLTHEKIAHHLGARRAGVSTICNELRDLGIIGYQRGNLRIVNPDQLQELACECYEAVRRSTNHHAELA
ncbi:MAG TPA: Crp/Fnr family transcriptional regulator [Pyrinomonadaceae bacterium]|nr:Crp/Fnr family transcriptional regulator [Pyrinomonadaceae bacterium]